jgi:hypothetical protein
MVKQNSLIANETNNKHNHANANQICKRITAIEGRSKAKHMDN